MGGLGAGGWYESKKQHFYQRVSEPSGFTAQKYQLPPPPAKIDITIS